MSQEIYFKAESHRERFLSAIKNSGKSYDEVDTDREYVAAFYLLTTSQGLWSKAQSYVSREGIDFEEMLNSVVLSDGGRRF